MSTSLKETLASLPQHLQSFQSTKLGPRFRNVQFTPNFQAFQGLQGRARSFHGKNPRAILLLAIMIFLVFWKNIIFDVLSSIAYTKPHSAVQDITVKNATLGFQDIFVLSLPERTDRRAPVVAAANATNITITVLDAIRDRQIPKSDYPKWWGSSGWVPKEGELGCLMSHVRTWRKMIYENISSAIIMESDVDWDLRIRDSLPGLAEGSKAIADWPFKDSKHLRDSSKDLSPYGDKWDLLWIGHCGTAADGDGRIYAFNDTSAPDEEHAWSFAERPGEGHRPKGTRIVFQMRKTVCTTAYAISLKGARKFEKYFREANSPIDLKMWSHCENDPKLACLSVWPQLISIAESKSNIQHTGGGFAFGHEVVEEKIAAGAGIQVSARVNAARKSASDPTTWNWEWKNPTKPPQDKKSGEKKEAKKEGANLEEEEETDKLKDETLVDDKEVEDQQLQ